MQSSVQTKTKFLLAMQVIQLANCVPAILLKMYRWIALLSLWELTRVEKRQKGETWNRNMFKHIQTQKYI